ncbi:MAG: PIN domain-containing protein [Puia sp.]|nr:PIN domain-containing protein [Puia sp.]
MDKVFVDTDIALDMLAERKPHYQPAALLFTLADQGKLTLFVSSLSFSNLHYLLSKMYTQASSRRILNTFKVLVKVLAVDEKIIDLALNSAFKDFEDAIQYFTAVENHVSILLTRNLKDYKAAEITVMTAEDYLLSI